MTSLVAERANRTVDLDALARLGRALADDTRRQILVQLAGSDAYPGALATELGTTRANISNHLACLRGCALVDAVPEGRRVRYSLAPGLADVLVQASTVVGHLLPSPGHRDGGP